MSQIVYEQLVKIERIIMAYLNVALTDDQKKEFVEQINKQNERDESTGDGNISVH